jgi:hypothetical protein
MSSETRFNPFFFRSALPTAPSGGRSAQGLQKRFASTWVINRVKPSSFCQKFT